MKTLCCLGALIACSTLTANLLAAEPTAKSGVKCVTVPKRSIPAPQARGKRYKLPATKWKKDPVLWGWTCELPDGSGLAFGGVHQTSDEARQHTRIKVGGKWTPIIEELRKKNPLQKRVKQVRALRDACKDALARARHIYFEGKPAGEEAKLLKARVAPAIDKLVKDLAKLTAELRGESGLTKYEAGQVKFALAHLIAAAGHIKPFGAKTSPKQMATMRKGQIELEIAAEAFDAEPPPRALSLITWEPKNKLFVVFGGDHMDYVTNDLWVFDPAKRRWFQRHPASAPEPRGDHHLDALGDGRIAMFGGYSFVPGKGYLHKGPARWIYDVARNTWTTDGHKEKASAANIRSAMYFPPAGPEHFMKGARPDAAKQEAMLKTLPVNTWVKLKTPVRLGGRDWATWVFDTDRDMLYVYGGGHSSYAGNDVARYHLATGRWEISDPVEIPLGCCGTNEMYPSGFNFNKRPWVKKHIWNGQAYDPGLKKMVMASVNDAKIDKYFYLYDPDRAEWSSRHRVAEGMGNDAYNMQVRHTKHGMLAWYGRGAWLLDAKTLKWSRIAVKGKMPGTCVDNCGLVYDSKRDRMLFITMGGYGKPYDGQVHALDMKTKALTQLNPKGMDKSKTWRLYPREVAHHPETDSFLFPQPLNIKGKVVADRYLAYETKTNRWTTVKLATAKGSPRFKMGVCSGIAWDPKRKLFWVGNSSWNGGVWVLRFDPAKAEIKPLVGGAAPPPTAKKK
jgi:hypothetical protein